MYSKYHNFTLQCTRAPTLFPLSVAPFPVLLLSSFSITFSLLLLLNVFVQIWERDEGHLVPGLFCGRLLNAGLPLTLHLLDLPQLLHMLLGLGTLGITGSAKSCVFFLCFEKLLLPTAYLPCEPSLPISVFPILSLCFSLSLKSSSPESPKTPSSPWDLEWMPA